MKSYIHLYRTNSEFTEVYNGPDYDEPWLSLTEENMDVNYNKTPPEPPKELTAITFGTITWVIGVASTGTFVKNPEMTSWPTGIYGIPEGWTVQDAS